MRGSSKASRGSRKLAAILAGVLAVTTAATITSADAASTNPRFLHTIRTADGALPANFAEHQISDNRRRVVFLTMPPRRGAQVNAYFRNLRTGRTVEVSRNNEGARLRYVDLVAFTPDERSVVFSGVGRNLLTGKRTPHSYTYLRHLRSGRITMIGHRDGVLPNGSVGAASFSADMTRVVFSSDASNLVPGDDNGSSDIFVQDLNTGAIDLVSTSRSGGPTNGHCSSPDADRRLRRVVFACDADNLVRRDTNGEPDIFLANLRTGTLKRVSTKGRRQANAGSFSPRITPNGRKVAFYTDASNLVGGEKYDSQTVVKSLRTGRYRRAAVGEVRWLSHDFRTMIHEVVVGTDMQLYAVNLDGSNRRLLSVNRSGAPARGGVFFLAFTRDDRAVMFTSTAANLGRKVPRNGWNSYLRAVP